MPQPVDPQSWITKERENQPMDKGVTTVFVHFSSLRPPASSFGEYFGSSGKVPTTQPVPPASSVAR